jgi:hypothetical protein
MDAISVALGGLGKNPLDGLTAALGGTTSQVSTAAQGGSDKLGSLIGVGAADGLTKTLASCAGINERAAGPLMGIVGSTALGGLKSAADKEGLDAAEVMRLLASQKGQIEKAVPSDLGRMLSTAGILLQAAEVASAARVAIPPAQPAPSGGWMKWALGAVEPTVLALLGSQLFGRAPKPAVTEAPALAPAAADELVVDGVNIGEAIQGRLRKLDGDARRGDGHRVRGRPGPGRGRHHARRARGCRLFPVRRRQDRPSGPDRRRTPRSADNHRWPPRRQRDQRDPDADARQHPRQADDARSPTHSPPDSSEVLGHPVERPVPRNPLIRAQQ